MTDKTIEEEKKLVAEKLMGWKFWKASNGENEFSRHPDGSDEMLVEKWNPQSDLNCWSEIWEMLWEKGLPGQYLGSLIQLLTRNKHKKGWEIHTAPPEICWKALIETLEDNNV